MAYIKYSTADEPAARAPRSWRREALVMLAIVPMVFAAWGVLLLAEAGLRMVGIR
jgi:hypothetical protein